MTLFTIIAGDGVLSEAEFVKGCLEDADLVGFAFRIYSIQYFVFIVFSILCFDLVGFLLFDAMHGRALLIFINRIMFLIP